MAARTKQSALALGALTRGRRRRIIFTLPSVGNITTTTPNTNGIIGPWAMSMEPTGPAN